MASKPYGPLVRFLRRLTDSAPAAEEADGVLLGRFVAENDHGAFAVLVRRHGPMVLHTCQGVLRDAYDAEDAFQATFLVLVRKAGSVSTVRCLGAWLHSVAYRVALKARAALARRRVQERQVAPMPHTDPDHAAIWRDLRPVLHEEVERLPARYRAPFVLCYLEGKTNEEAARLLGWPKGTVLSSLARARERLRGRLERRGLALAPAALGVVLAEQAAAAASAAVPAALADTTVQAAAQFAAAGWSAAGVSEAALAYTKAVTNSMMAAQVKVAVGVLLTGAVLAVGVGAWSQQRNNAPAPIVVVEQPPAPPAKAPRPDDRTLLQGAWSVVTAEQHGAPVEQLIDAQFTVTGDDFVMNAPRGEVRWTFRKGTTRGTVQLAPDDRPRGLNKARVLHAIYQLDGDRLTLCIADADVRERPLEFATRPEDRRLLLVLRRDVPMPSNR